MTLFLLQFLLIADCSFFLEVTSEFVLVSRKRLAFLFPTLQPGLHVLHERVAT